MVININTKAKNSYKYVRDHSDKNILNFNNNLTNINCISFNSN